MASALRRRRDYNNEHLAKKYSETSEFQLKCGKDFVLRLGVEKGASVLDMGCGTGELTAFITDQVGTEGHVVGVDPDEERIKIAVQKHTVNRKNLSFKVGESTDLLSKDFYDITICSFVFHWLRAEEKLVFLQTAFKGMKPNGRIGILTFETVPAVLHAFTAELFPHGEFLQNKNLVQLVQKSVTESLLEKSGFEIISSEYVEAGYTFPTLDSFITWNCATLSGYIDESQILQHKKTTFADKFANDDGSITVQMPTLYETIAIKIVK